MALWDVEDLAKEISDMEVIFMRNKGSELLPKMKDALKSKVDAVQLLTPSSFVRLSDAVLRMKKDMKNKSSLPMDMKKELESCLEAKAATSIQGPTRLQTTPQSMTMPYNYLTQNEWKQIQAGINTIDAANILIKRIKQCGLRSLKEDTKKHLTAFLVSLQMKANSVLPPAMEMYKLSQFVQETFGACGVQPLHAGLATYPPSPYDIGEARDWKGSLLLQTRACIGFC